MTSIITNISQLRDASTINISNLLRNWQPYINEAEKVFIKPFIGTEFYEQLKEEANSSSSGYSGYEDVLALAQTAIALYALYLGVDEMALSVSSQGIQVVASDSHKPAPQYAVLNLKETWIARAHRNMDFLLEYLDEHKEDFPLYLPATDGLFITSAKDFQQYVDIRGSRRLYISLKPIMKNIERKFILNTLGKDYYDELKEKINSSGSDVLSDDDQDIIDRISPAIAHLSIARALQEISIDVLDWGVFDTAANSFDNVRGKANTNAQRIGVMLEANQRDGEAEIKQLQEYLDTNASTDKYATYFASTKYIGSGNDPTSRGQFTNTKDKGIFVA